MGRDWDGAKGHPKPSPMQGHGHRWALNIHSVRVGVASQGWVPQDWPPGIQDAPVEASGKAG